MHGAKLWIVAPDELPQGERLAMALGASAVSSPTHNFKWNLSATSTLVPIECCQNLPHDPSPSDVVVVIFDVADAHSCTTVLNMVNSKTRPHTANRMVLVGVDNQDGNESRLVSSEQALELALVEFEEYVELPSIHTDATKVAYLRQLITTWITQDSQRQERRPPQQPPLPVRQIRTSVWLYDPTEDIHVSGSDDAQIRPISKALFEMRGAACERRKATERPRRQSTAKLGRSRYHGPTESSRSMRWQAHEQQQRQQVRVTRRRQSTSAIDVSEEHAAIEGKSFMQSTKLMKQRAIETQHLLSTKANMPSKTRQTTAFKHRSPRARTPSLSPTKDAKPNSQCKDINLNTQAVHLQGFESLPSYSTVPALSPTPTKRYQVFEKEDSRQPPPAPPPPPLTAALSSTPVPTQTTYHDMEEHDEDTDGDALSDGIDELLDYFDGVALPL